MAKRRDLPNLHDLLAFDAAARAKNFTQAAEALNVQQPAVSRRVAQLESWLGAPLFHRRGSQLSLTQAGERFLSAISAGLDEIEMAAASFRREGKRKLLTVDVSIVFASCWLIKRLGDFRSLRPDIDVQLVSRYANTVPPSNASDVVVYFRDEGQVYPDQRPLFLEDLIVVCSGPFYERAGHDIGAETLPRQPLLFLNESQHLDDWKRFLLPLGIEAPVFSSERSFNNFVVYLKAILSGEGLGLAWRELVADELAAGTLVQPIEASFQSDRGYYAYLRDGSEDDPEASAFVDWLVEQGRSAER